MNLAERATKIRRGAARSTVALCVIAAAVFGAESEADAAAIGVTYWGGNICAFGHCVGGNTHSINIQGGGLNISGGYSGLQVFFPHGPLCNWWIDFDGYDTNHNPYFHQQ